MFTKIWITLLIIAGLTALGVAIVAPRGGDRLLHEAQGNELYGVHSRVEMQLKLRSRDWVDQTARLSTDSALVQITTESNSERVDATAMAAIIGRINGRLDELRDRLGKSAQPDLMIAVNSEGKQIGRWGTGAEKAKPGVGLVGFPLIAGALQGYQLDDMWSYEGKLYLMAGSPIISAKQEKYVGALILGKEITKSFAQRLKEDLGDMDIAFYLRGQLIGATSDSSEVAKLPRLYTDPKTMDEIKSEGRSKIVPIGQGSSSYLVMMTPLHGEAEPHHAFYALLAPPPEPIGLVAALKRVTANDLTFKKFPWVTLGFIGLVLCAASIALLHSRHDRPLNRLVTATYKVVHGDSERINEQLFSGTLYNLARAVNELGGRPRKKGGPGADGATRPVGLSMPPQTGMLGGDTGLASGSLGLETGPELSNGMNGMAGGFGSTIDTMSLTNGGGDDASSVMNAGRVVNSAMMNLGGQTDDEEPPTRLQFGGGETVTGADLPLMTPVNLPTGASEASLSAPMPMMDLMMSNPEIRPLPGGSPMSATGANPARAPGAASKSPTIMRPGGGAPSLGGMNPPPSGANSLPPLGNAPSLGSANDVGLDLGSISGILASPDLGQFSNSRPPSSPSLNLGTIMGAPPASAPKGGAGELPSLLGDLNLDTLMGASPMGSSPMGSGNTVMGMAPPPSLAPPQTLAPAPMSAPAPLPAAHEAGQESDDVHFKMVFDEFLATKRQCGERTDNVTLDRFIAKLNKNREELVGRYGCKTVRFQVYVKNGKAAVKATPVK